ncbi:hypothetical protein [Acidiphilium rubrum]|uniref:Uncharacterized protein n=1 Tax=Acidiphilium rubrum TaxID=526 RepID=A0A8G2CHX0_ACIRU|nr:hypothetical protein [Acidiphilium rubrum]SIQ15485.1 hypothetical protein SAMN05421828_10238 [Acidiphilium rubrum]
MPRSPGLMPLEPSFDIFLFAVVGEDRRGVPVSVLSILARSNIDPWEEAASLARLPRTTAADRLAGLITAVPDGIEGSACPETTASRLVKLLPHASIAIDHPFATMARTTTMQFPAVSARSRVAAILLCAALIASLVYVVSSSEPDTQTGHTAEAAITSPTDR